MKLHLYIDHTAEIERDGLPVLEICNGKELGGGGRLVVADELMEVRHGGEEPRLPGKVGVFGGVFVTSEGIRYSLRAVRVNGDGSLSSEVDFSRKYFVLHKSLDGLARAVEELTYEVSKMKGEIIPNALGFMGIGEKEEE